MAHHAITDDIEEAGVLDDLEEDHPWRAVAQGPKPVPSYAEPAMRDQASPRVRQSVSDAQHRVLDQNLAKIRLLNDDCQLSFAFTFSMQHILLDRFFIRIRP